MKIECLGKPRAVWLCYNVQIIKGSSEGTDIRDCFVSQATRIHQGKIKTLSMDLRVDFASQLPQGSHTWERQGCAAQRSKGILVGNRVGVGLTYSTIASLLPFLLPVKGAGK